MLHKAYRIQFLQCNPDLSPSLAISISGYYFSSPVNRINGIIVIISEHKTLFYPVLLLRLMYFCINYLVLIMILTVEQRLVNSCYNRQRLTLPFWVHTCIMQKRSQNDTESKIIATLKHV